MSAVCNPVVVQNKGVSPKAAVIDATGFTMTTTSRGVATFYLDCGKIDSLLAVSGRLALTLQDGNTANAILGGVSPYLDRDLNEIDLAPVPSTLTSFLQYVVVKEDGKYVLRPKYGTQTFWRAINYASVKILYLGGKN